MFNGSTYAAERLALAELELARVELVCRFDSCGLDCRVRESVRQSVEAVRANAKAPSHSEVWISPRTVNEFIRELLP